MNIRRLQGLILILSEVSLLISAIAPHTPPFNVLGWISTALFILGIPAIQTIQPSGSIGWTGIVLVELEAGLYLAYQSGITHGSAMPVALGFTAAISAMAGRLIIGYFTVTKNVFPAWVGWAFIAKGLVSFIGNMVDFGSLETVFITIVFLFGAVALFGYGYFIYLRKKES